MAVWSDGSRTTGEEVREWNRPEGQPKLGDRTLFNNDNPIRWLRDTTLHASPMPTAYVEFVGGDRLPGQVTGFVREPELPYQPVSPHLLVEPAVTINGPGLPARTHLRIMANAVERVVWEPHGQRRLQPGTLFYRDGRQVTFRSLRWTDAGVRLLLEQGTTQAPFDQIAELHMPKVDPWDAYYSELAELTPSGQGRLMQIEATGGLRVTTSLERFDAKAGNDDPKTWIHAIQPAWSLDMLFVPHRQIRQRTFFALDEVPLTRIAPRHSLQRSALASGWKHWRADVNVQGGSLRSGGNDYAWGFGVHAHSELEFELPPTARVFRTRLGLDQLAAGGGCVRARIFAGSNQSAAETSGRPLYETPVIIGSLETRDSGELELERQGKSLRLVLVCDTATDDRPTDADPLDIRDIFDWLEPLVELDADSLAVEVRARMPTSYPGLEPWTASGKYGTSWHLLNQFYANGKLGPAFRSVIKASKEEPLVLSQKVEVDDAHRFLAIKVSHPDGHVPGSRLLVRVDGKEVSNLTVPVWRDPPEVPPLVVPLAEYSGQDIRLELEFKPPREPHLLAWVGAALVAEPPAKK
jgi:hypothetical protein